MSQFEDANDGIPLHLHLATASIGAGEADMLMTPGNRPPPVGSPWGGVHAGVLAGIAGALFFAIAAFATALALGLVNGNKIDSVDSALTQMSGIGGSDVFPSACGDVAGSGSLRQCPSGAEGDTTLGTFCTGPGGARQECDAQNSSVCWLPLDNVDMEAPAAPGIQSGGKSLTIAINQRGYYRLQVAIIGKPRRCAFREFVVTVYDELTGLPIQQISEEGLVPLEQTINGVQVHVLCGSFIVFQNASISFRLTGLSDPKDAIVATGRLIRSNKLDILDGQTFFDATTKIKYIPLRPSPPLPPPGQNPLFPVQFPNDTATYPWFGNVLPSKVVVNPIPELPSPPFPPGLDVFPDNDGYSKFRSVPTSLDTYFERDTLNAPPTDEALTLFLTALEDRGTDNSGRKNHRKFQYMAALTGETVQQYVPKTQAFANKVYGRVVTNQQSFLQVFKDELIDYFLAVHIGYDEYPQFVKQYFRLFLDIVGFGNPTIPGRNEAFMFGGDNSQAVRDYFAARTTVVVEAKDTSSIVYYWAEAGLSVEAQLTEAVHNIVAFSQFEHQMALMINDTLGLTDVPFPPFQVSYGFFAAYTAAADDTERQNVIRESYRILLPNSNDFSQTIEAAPSGFAVQARHLRLPIQITAYELTNPGFGAQDMFTFDIAQYGAGGNPFGLDYDTDFSAGSCPGPAGPTDTFLPEQRFAISPVDNETVIDLCNPKTIPVFPLLRYYPFGAGYRRCAGEVFNMMVTNQLYARFANVPWKVVPLTPDTPYVALAPFVAVPDVIFYNESAAA